MANELFWCFRIPTVELETRLNLLNDLKKILAAFESCIDWPVKLFSATGFTFRLTLI
jgi:hypothetical protein